MIATVLSLVFLGLFLFWFDLPTRTNIHVTDASLTLPDSTMHQQHYKYSLVLNITFRNPNWYFKTYHENTRLVAYCKNSSSDKVLGTVSLNPFGQGTKKAKAFTALSFKGDNDDNLKACRATSDGDSDDIVIKLYLSNIYYLGGQNVKESSYEFKTQFICDLRVPLITAGMTSPKAFRNTKCKSTFQLYY